MIIIEVCGGLGNQMFQFALYTKMLTLGKEVKLDLTSFRSRQALRNFELGIFGVDCDIATEKEIRKYKKTRSWNKLLGHKTKENIYIENLDAGYQPIIYSFEDKYLQGYWQCEKYFADIRDVILKKYIFPLKENSNCKKILEQIKKTESVGLHVRRGDYLSEQNNKVYGNICTIDYYQSAISYIKRAVSNAVFFLFTNDMIWVRNHIYREGMIVVDCNDGEQDYLDMFLMSQCKHNIVANSSFSWWGAWLNQNTNKIVIAPSKWFNNHEVTDTICRDWVRIDNKGDLVKNEGGNYTVE